MIFLVAAVIAAGCQPFRPDTRDLTRRVPEQFSLYDTSSPATDRWWTTFDDTELNGILEAALAHNLTLEAAWARLRQASSLAVQSGADRYPDLTGGADYLRGRQRAGDGLERDLDSATVSLLSTYEIDLWGRVASRYRSAHLTAAATRQDLYTAAITISAEVVERWIGIISQRMQKKLLQEQLRINRTLLDLVKLRFRNGLASALDVYQQKQLVDEVMAGMPLVEQQEQLLLHQLAVLLGRPPLAEVAVSRDSLPAPAPLPAVGLPADLLSARPDIQAAGMRLAAADWQIAQARANRLPALRLTARGGYGEGELNALFDNWLVSLAANLTAPLLDGGRLRSEVDRTRAVSDERLAAYYDTVLNAVKEVEDALVREAKQREHLQGVRQVTDTARKALEEAGVRYRNGLTDYLPVLTQLLSVQSLERDLIRKQAELLTIRVGLHRALGGNWPATLEMPDPKSGNGTSIGMNQHERDD
ncbi:MAG: efflux transporter outer membrane subunit [Desulfatitalea sp.]|nr:efflux transporter outer membrane subunit [Desulfatitalea sp.]NNK01021.1 efflux transporter outer membrane subunit [Desulfatitalea sp.]